MRLLDAGKTVTYVDHHFPGDIPSHANLDLRIDTDANWCTSLIVDRSLDGAAHRWAIVGAFGDNLHSVASQLAGLIGIDARKTRLLEQLGCLLNYNSYGDAIEDLYRAYPVVTQSKWDAPICQSKARRRSGRPRRQRSPAGSGKS